MQLVRNGSAKLTEEKLNINKAASERACFIKGNSSAALDFSANEG